MKRQNPGSALGRGVFLAGLLVTFSIGEPLSAKPFPPTSSKVITPETYSICGDGVCDADEDEFSCPEDCSYSPPPPSGPRTGMTWTVLGQQDGYVHVGADAQTNAYAGDTTVDQYLPLLCLLVDGRTAPGNIAFDFYGGWAQGAIRATAAIKGAALTSQSAGDAICASAFGSGWRMAEFHDGRYGPGLSYAGGWSYWGAGRLTSGTRFWVAISDQPANPWNSAGDPLPPVAMPEDDVALKTRLQDLMQPLLPFLQSQSFRDLVYSDIANRFDGDNDVLLATVIADAEQAQIVDPSSPSWQDLKAQVAQFQNVNGNAYYPQIYIPNYGDGALPDPDPTVTVFESDLSRDQLPAYGLDSNGNLYLKSQPVDEAYSETHEVWVLSLNERVDMDPAALATVQALDKIGATGRRPRARAAGGAATSPAPAAPRTATAPEAGSLQKGLTCNPTGLRNNNGLEFLQSFRIPDPSSVEHWTSGKLEPRVVIVGKGGAEIGNKYFGKIKRKTVKNGYGTNLFLTTWDRSVWGDYWAYKWIEVDNGPKIELSLGLSAEIKKLLKVNFDVKATFEKKFDDMGSAVVGFNESTYLEYGTGVVYWSVCSSGGDGGTGNTNLALSALAAASSTYSGYSPARVNDGSQDTALGGATSWANAAYVPQWVQLDFGTNKTFSRVVIYTSSGYPIQDFTIQVWNSGLGVWQDVPGAQVTGNTSLTVTLNFTAQTARLVRILGTKGPNIQQGYVRVNEFEVYP